MGNIIRRTDIPEGDGNLDPSGLVIAVSILEEPISPKGTETILNCVFQKLNKY
ncbi:hypothetical protein HMPREF1986_02194 [Oribacterium sp. oral taxon 078 str. F0263]|nr:hypothetical protein HMPREF1986_02194 [Oribacterium sp. oral taxon 078 str. F0263]